MADDLTALHNAKAALDQGLITPQDYDVVKVAFLKAQQLRSGKDAGLLREEDYARVRESFLSVMDFNLMTTFPASSSAGIQAPPVAEASSGAVPVAAPDPVSAPPPPPSQPRQSAMPAAMAAAMGTAAAGGALPQLSSTTPAAPTPVSGSANSSAGGVGPTLPPDMPDTCRGATNGKVGAGSTRQPPPAPPPS